MKNIVRGIGQKYIRHILDKCKQVIHRVDKDPDPNRTAPDNIICHQNTADRSIQHLRQILVHKSEQDRADHNGKRLSVRQKQMQNIPAENHFLNKRRKNDRGNKI